MDFQKLKQFLTERQEPKYRYLQIVSEVVLARALKYEDMFIIPKKLRDELTDNIPIISVKSQNVLESRDKKSYKAILQLSDGNLIETVLISPKPKLWSVCLSCQVGCSMGCKFCATGKLGLTRNLTTEEICDQILFWKQYFTQKKLKIRINNIVYMGMGEPFVNKDNVFASIENFCQADLFGFGHRNLSVSTCGIIPVIKEFADKFPQLNLAISLHAPNQELRQKLMPIAEKYPLRKLIESIKYYLEKTNRQIFFEYILISGENDKDKDALELSQLLLDNFGNQKHLIHVNLINYNDTGDKFSASKDKQAEKFKKILEEAKISVSFRKSLGQEIKGACGQLAGGV